MYTYVGLKAGLPDLDLEGAAVGNCTPTQDGKGSLGSQFCRQPFHLCFGLLGSPSAADTLHKFFFNLWRWFLKKVMKKVCRWSQTISVSEAKWVLLPFSVPPYHAPSANSSSTLLPSWRKDINAEKVKCAALWVGLLWNLHSLASPGGHREFN